MTSSTISYRVFAAINHDDKEKIRKIVYQFLPDLFFAPRGNQASDDDDEGNDWLLAGCYLVV